jgi:hypothetical protein
MTMPIDFTAGTALPAASLDSNFAYVNPVWDIENVGGVSMLGLIAHSSTVYSITNGATIYLWNGTTLTSKNTDLETDNMLVLCADDATKAFAIEATASGETAYTADSGTTWTTKTSTAMGTEVRDVSFPTANLIVVAGDDAAGTDHIIYSTDQGASWTDATTSPSTDVACMAMFSSTVGYAVDTGGNIWKTTDGADVWADTGDNSSATSKVSSIYCLDADTCIIVCGNGAIEKYVNSTNTITTVYFDNINTYNSGIVYTNVYLYTIMRNSDANGGILLFSDDDGDTWKSQPLHQVQVYTGLNNKKAFCPYDTGKIAYIYSANILKQDRSNL